MELFFQVFSYVLHAISFLQLFWRLFSSSANFLMNTFNGVRLKHTIVIVFVSSAVFVSHFALYKSIDRRSWRYHRIVLRTSSANTYSALNRRSRHEILVNDQSIVVVMLKVLCRTMMVSPMEKFTVSAYFGKTSVKHRQQISYTYCAYTQKYAEICIPFIE